MSLTDGVSPVLSFSGAALGAFQVFRIEREQESGRRFDADAALDPARLRERTRQAWRLSLSRLQDIPAAWTVGRSSAVQGPDPDGGVRGGADGEPPVGSDGDGCHGTLVALQGSQQLPRGQVPDA